jgi:hypothetical protein
MTLQCNAGSCAAFATKQKAGGMTAGFLKQN